MREVAQVTELLVSSLPADGAYTRLTCKLKFDCDSTKLHDALRLHEITSACANQFLTH